MRGFTLERSVKKKQENLQKLERGEWETRFDAEISDP